MRSPKAVGRLQGQQGPVDLDYEPDGPEVLADSVDPQPQDFLSILNGWMELTGVPFVLSAPAVRKLHFVHRVVSAAAGHL